MIYRTRGEKIFNVVNIILLGCVGLLAVYPFMYTLSISLSTAAQASRQGLHILPNPRELSFSAYSMVLRNPEILIGYANSLFRTIVGTTVSVMATCLVAYPLARRSTPLRRQFTFLILFTMIFSGGLVPMFLLVTRIGLYDTRLSLILPCLLTAFNVIIVKNFFQAIPASFAESAMIDGASEFRILWTIYVPLSTPVIATITLWTAVLHWNHWFDALLYIDSDTRQVLQIFLQRIVIESNTDLIEAGVVSPDILQYTPETIKAATVIVTILPMLILYPFVQRYFVKGIMLGGIKE